MNPRSCVLVVVSLLLPVAIGIGALDLFVPHAHAAEKLYTCGMHPQIIKKEPGNCPVCGMKLTPIRANAGGGAPGGKKLKFYKSTMDPMQISDKPGKDSMGMEMVPVYEEGAATGANVIQIEAATIQRMNLKTAPVTRGPVRREIRTVGTIAYNEQGIRDITTKYEGWIEKLFVNATWATVKAGDPLFEIYSPDLYNAQLNYLVASRSEPNQDGALKRAALGRLQLFDIPAAFITELARAGEPRRTVVFPAPADGVVIDKMAVVGQMIKPGERIYRLADLSSVWVLAQIYEQDLPFVQPGQDASVRVTYGPKRELEGKIELLLPQVEEQTRAATARIVLPNPELRLRPGMFVDVRFAAQLADSAVLVPDIAVLRSGERNTVFVAKEGGSFEPREVKLGARTAGNDYEVLNGLAEGERVVTSGQFMLDSESQLREAIQKMLKTPEGGATVAAPAAAPDMGKSKIPAAGAPAPDPALLTPLALVVSDAAERLAADDLAGYQQHLPAMRKALDAHLGGDPNAAKGPLANFKDALPDQSNIKAAREDFAKFSTAVSDLARANNLQQTAKLHVFECPMAPAVGKGRWMQRTAELKNPFFGRAMLTCGEELK